MTDTWKNNGRLRNSVIWKYFNPSPICGCMMSISIPFLLLWKECAGPGTPERCLWALGSSPHPHIYFFFFFSLFILAWGDWFWGRFTPCRPHTSLLLVCYRRASATKFKHLKSTMDKTGILNQAKRLIRVLIKHWRVYTYDWALSASC